MESDTFTKKYNFRLPDRVIERLDSMIKQGIARNRTEALVYIIDDYGKDESKLNVIEKDIEDIRKQINEFRVSVREFESVAKQLRNKKLLD